MTTEDRNIKLKHLITCMKCEVSGKVCDTSCPTQYEAGNMGEIIENLEAISKILEQQPCEDAVSRHDALNCVTGNEVRYRMVNDIRALPSVTPKKRSDTEESDAEFMCRVMSETVNKSTDDRNFIGGF